MGYLVEEQIAAILTPVLGNEIYPVVHPDPDGTISAVSNTYAVYTKIGGQSYNKIAGDDPMSKVRMQVSIYSTSYSDLKAKESAVNNAMQAANLIASNAVDLQQDQFLILGALSNFSSSVPTDGFENDTRRFFLHMQFYCWSKSF